MTSNALALAADITANPVNMADSANDPHHILLLKLAEAAAELTWLVFRDRTIATPISDATDRVSDLAKTALYQWQCTHCIPPWFDIDPELANQLYPRNPPKGGKAHSLQTPATAPETTTHHIHKEKPMRKEIKLTRSNVTLADFITELKAMNVATVDLDDMEWFTVPKWGGSSVSYYISHGVKHYTLNGHTTMTVVVEPPAALKEIIRDRAYDFECYVQLPEGNIWHECLKFTHQNGTEGTGYYYQLEVNPGEDNADGTTAVTDATSQEPPTEEMIYQIAWTLRFDDNNMVAERFRDKYKRNPTEEEWQEINDKENLAMAHHIGLLKEQFGVVAVNEEDTRDNPSDSGGLTGTCFVTKELGLRLLRESDQDRTNYLFEDMELSKPGPSSEAAWKALHECDSMTVSFDEFHEELIAAYERSLK